MNKLERAKNRFTEEELETLRDPRISLPMYGQIADQVDNGILIPYDPYRLTNNCQQTILSYLSDTPKQDSGHNLWLILIAGRQSGKSVTAEYGAYTKTAYTYGYDHVCMADDRARAEYLHRRVHTLHDKWPENVRQESLYSNEIRQLSFANRATMRVIQARDGAAGIGQSFDSFHGSEIPWCDGFAETWSMLQPAIINRKNTTIVLEATPAPMHFPSSSWWQETAFQAYRREGRFILAFFPFWDTLSNVRPWYPEDKPDQHELKLLEEFGAKGLTLEHLAFRRETMDSDKEIKKEPLLFDMYYPLSLTTCWGQNISGIIPYSAIKHSQSKGVVKWDGNYKQYLEVNRDAVYVIGVDPVGFAARNHGSFQVLEVWEDEITQFSVYADYTDPIVFTDILIDEARKCNNALIVVESTGVGQGVLSQLVSRKYSNIFYDENNNPGQPATHLDELMTHMIDLLSTILIIKDEDTCLQLQSYKDDKKLEKTERLLLLQRSTDTKRRKRPHWDKISALLMACFGVLYVPNRIRPKERIVRSYADMSYLEHEAYRRTIMHVPQTGRLVPTYRRRRG